MWILRRHNSTSKARQEKGNWSVSIVCSLWVCNALSTVYYGILVDKEKNFVLPTNKTNFNTGWTVSNKSKVAPRGYCLLDELSCQHSYIIQRGERVNISVFVCAGMYTCIRRLQRCQGPKKLMSDYNVN